MKRKLLSLLLLVSLLLTGCVGAQIPDTTDPVHTTLSTGNSVSTGVTETTTTTETTVPSESAKPSEVTTPSEATKPTEGITPPETSGSTGNTTPSKPSGNDTQLTVHYIDVGQADSILLECDGKFMIIDGGNVADSSLVVSYLLEQGVEELEAVVNTHPHEDHVGGLPGVLAVFPVKKVYAPTKTYSSNCFDDFVRYTDQQNLEITIPKPGDTFSLGDAEVTVLGPVTSYSEVNNTSIVLMVTLGKTRFLFTGDMETKAETDMLDYWAGKKDLSADVLKVGHHGSSTSTGYRFLYETDPLYAVISVGKNNQYGHPNADPLSRLRDADVTVYRTDQQGHIVITSDGENLGFSWGNSSVTPDIPSDPKEEHTKPTGATQPSGNSKQYIGNKNSQILHLPTCSSLPKESNRVYFNDYNQAIGEGYRDCSKCKPSQN